MPSWTRAGRVDLASSFLNFARVGLAVDFRENERDRETETDGPTERKQLIRLGTNQTHVSACTYYLGTWDREGACTDTLRRLGFRPPSFPSSLVFTLLARFALDPSFSHSLPPLPQSPPFLSLLRANPPPSRPSAAPFAAHGLARLDPTVRLP